MNFLNDKESTSREKTDRFEKMSQLSTEKSILTYREVKHSLLFLSFFSHYTAPLYQFNNIEFIKNYLPILLCVQGLVYEADFKIEAGQKNENIFNKIKPWLDRKNIIIEIVKELNLYTPMLEKEADNLSEYWDLENQLMKSSEVSHPMLIKAIEFRASDIMMLHHICQRIAAIHLDKEIWKTIQAIEAIRDIEADLRQYEADTLNNDFNIYRMFIKLYGSEARSILTDELERRKILYEEMINKLPLGYKQKFKDLTRCYYAIRPPIEVPECTLSV